jgi:hypothetical protein
MGNIQLKPAAPPVEPKKEEIVALPLSVERNRFKIQTRCLNDKYDAMKAISKLDPTAEFRVTGDWSFRVRTALTYNELMQIMMITRSFERLKRAWFF